MTLSRWGPAFIAAIGLLMAMAGAFAPEEESGATGTLPARLVVPLGMADRRDGRRAYGSEPHPHWHSILATAAPAQERRRRI